MKGLAMLAVAGVFGAVAYAAVATLKGAAASRRARRLSETPWMVVDDEDDEGGQCRVVKVVKPGEPDYLIGAPIPLNLKAWEFDEVLIERRLDAQAKADALNRRLPR